MKITCYLSTNDREQEIGRALRMGVTKAGDEVTLKTRTDFWEGGTDDGADVICVVGVKSKKMFDDCKAMGKIPLIIDKGYYGRGEMYRMSLGSYQPEYIGGIIADMWEDPVVFHSRLNACGMRIKPRQLGGHAVMYVGSSQKYCNFHELGDNNDYARKVVGEIHKYWTGPERHVIYRPKPSWWAKMKAGERRDDLADLGVTFSGPNVQFAKELTRCRAVVTHGSNGAAEALAAGVPCIMLSPEGTSPVWHLCGHDLKELEDPFFPRVDDIHRTLAAMGWCQFSISEMAHGLAWHHVKHFYLEAKAKRASGANEEATL